MLDEACRAAAGWPRTAERPGFVSVNVAPGQLRQKGLATNMLGMLSAAGLEPRLLVLELTNGVSQDLDPDHRRPRRVARSRCADRA